MKELKFKQAVKKLRELNGLEISSAKPLINGTNGSLEKFLELKNAIRYINLASANFGLNTYVTPKVIKVITGNTDSKNRVSFKFDKLNNSFIIEVKGEPFDRDLHDVKHNSYDSLMYYIGKATEIQHKIDMLLES